MNNQTQQISYHNDCRQVTQLLVNMYVWQEQGISVLAGVLCWNGQELCNG